MSGAPRLGPRARAALKRAVEGAMRGAVTRPSPNSVEMQFRYTLDLVETAMILDTAEAEAAAQDPHG